MTCGRSHDQYNGALSSSQGLAGFPGASPECVPAPVCDRPIVTRSDVPWAHLPVSLVP